MTARLLSAARAPIKAQANTYYSPDLRALQQAVEEAEQASPAQELVCEPVILCQPVARSSPAQVYHGPLPAGGAGASRRDAPVTTQAGFRDSGLTDRGPSDAPSPPAGSSPASLPATLASEPAAGHGPPSGGAPADGHVRTCEDAGCDCWQSDESAVGHLGRGRLVPGRSLPVPEPVPDDTDAGGGAPAWDARCVCEGCTEMVPAWWATRMCEECFREDCQHPIDVPDLLRGGRR